VGKVFGAGYIAMHATLASRDVVGFTLSRMNVVWLFYTSSPDCSTVSSNIVLLDLQGSLGWFPPSVLQWTTWLSGPPKFLSILSSPLLAWIHICSLSFPSSKINCCKYCAYCKIVNKLSSTNLADLFGKWSALYSYLTWGLGFHECRIYAWYQKCHFTWMDLVG